MDERPINRNDLCLHCDNKIVNYTISKPIFWGTTIIAGLGFSIWSFSDAFANEEIGIGGILFLTALLSPIIFGFAAVCGWLVSAFYAFLSQKSEPIKDHDAVKSENGISRVTVAFMVGSCFATTSVMMIENYMHTIYSGEISLMWISAFFIGTILTLGLLRVFSKRNDVPK